MPVLSRLALVLLAGCTQRVLLVAPLTNEALSLECTDASDAASCQPSTRSDPADLALDGTVGFVLPNACVGQFDGLTLLKRKRGSRSVVASCGGTSWTCTPPDSCTEGASSSSSALELALPDTCAGWIHVVQVEHIRRSTPSSYVICAPPDNPPGSTP